MNEEQSAENDAPRMVWIQAARHEIRCAECRVSWSSWAVRILTGLRKWWVDRTHSCECACSEGGSCGPCRRCGR